jgi:hypothetical protein
MCSKANNFISTWEGFLMASLKDKKGYVESTEKLSYIPCGNKIKVGAWGSGRLEGTNIFKT